MTASSDSDQHMDDILSNPLREIHPDRLAICFRGAISSKFASDLKSSERLKERINERIRLFYALPDGPVEPAAIVSPDREIAVMSDESLQELISNAGVIYWSKAIAGAVLATDVAALRSEIGKELYHYALLNNKLSGPNHQLPEQGTILESITKSGLLCLHAWWKQTDPAVGASVWLKLAPNPVFDDGVPAEYLEVGPKIIRYIASQ